MGTEFTPIFLFGLVAVAMALAMVALSWLLGPKKKTPVKQMPYESGMDPVGDARQRFDIRFYLVAIVFLLFDVELLYLYPWAAGQWSANDTTVATASANPETTPPTTPANPTSPGVPPEYRNLVFVAVMFLVVMLTAADAYAWRKGVFEWR